ncbi:CYFA0S04e00650g1_1 [Cyberlindnera fabianii]|uniref:CYFA0S04e00650g1_1 n=1 Tax=Cyberlindnera fabianii TaxID=36022 RepID=A0A061AYX5_CYBFA|nr:CYFA0S04e00650g1_1 [Cyberlindnera fabianii]
MSYTEDTKAQVVADVEEVGSIDVASNTSVNYTGDKSIWRRVDNFVKVKNVVNTHRWSNGDMEPTPLEDQTWKPIHFLAYWVSDMYSASSWRIAGSFIDLGLSPGLFYGCNIIGYFLVAILISVHGLVGSTYHIPFSVQTRASFGFYFSYCIVIIRFIVGCYYYGINAYTGAECIQTMILAMSPRFANMEDKIPSSAVTSQLMLCYFIYNVICIPFHYIRAPQIRKFLVFKLITGPTVGIALMIYLNQRAGGAKKIWSQPSKVSGSSLSWLIVQCIATNLSSYATLACNVNDFTRYSKSKYSVVSQMYAIPVNQGILTPMGIVGGIASEIIYGEVLWDPLLIAQKWIDTPGGRCAAFFVAFSYLIAQIGINISANSISAANDLTALFPKYVNIRRGQYIVLALGGWALCPWEVMANATTLTAFMGGYSIFLGPIAAVMICDYFLVHKKKYKVTELYNPNGIYKFGKFGTNWRAILPLIIGFVPLLPGLATYINTNITMPVGMLNLYLIGYFYSFSSAFLVYYLTCYFFPPADSIVDEAVIPPHLEEVGEPDKGAGTGAMTRYILKRSIV